MQIGTRDSVLLTGRRRRWRRRRYFRTTSHATPTRVTKSTVQESEGRYRYEVTACRSTHGTRQRGPRVRVFKYKRDVYTWNCRGEPCKQHAQAPMQCVHLFLRGQALRFSLPPPVHLYGFSYRIRGAASPRPATSAHGDRTRPVERSAASGHTLSQRRFKPALPGKRPRGEGSRGRPDATRPRDLRAGTTPARRPAVAVDFVVHHSQANQRHGRDRQRERTRVDCHVVSTQGPCRGAAMGHHPTPPKSRRRFRAELRAPHARGREPAPTRSLRSHTSRSTLTPAAERSERSV